MNRRPLRVLVVDDSALVRQTLLALLTEEGFEVSVAADPIIAAERMRKSDPDVMLLDLEMPRMDGLSFLRKLMSEKPLPVVICSAVAGRGTDKALSALEEGAVDIVVKPQIGVRDFLYESAVMLSDAIRAAAVAQVRRRAIATHERVLTSQRPRTSGAAADYVVAIGASTGGTEALRTILSEIETDAAPAMVIVQHMPRYFTAAFAKSLDQASRICVREATSGEELREGLALLAPGDAHMTVQRSGSGYRVIIADGPLVSRHRPSVDVLFRSVADCARGNATGILLTGMGDDGADGLLAMRRSGAFTIAQDESTSVVFGMPREAIARGAAEEILPVHAIAAALKRRDARKEN